MIHKLVAAHRSHDCLYESVQCPNSIVGCGKKLRRGELAKHLAEECVGIVDCPCCKNKIIPSAEPHRSCITEMAKNLETVKKELATCETRIKTMEEKRKAAADCRKKFASQNAGGIEIYTARKEEKKVRILPDGRVRCKHCGRAFNSDRIEKHESVCLDKTSLQPIIDDLLILEKAAPQKQEQLALEPAWKAQSEGLRSAVQTERQAHP